MKALLLIALLWGCSTKAPKTLIPERSRGTLPIRRESRKLPGDVPIPTEDAVQSGQWILMVRKQINGLHHDCDDFLSPIEKDFRWRPGKADMGEVSWIDKDAASKEREYFKTLSEAALYYIALCREKREKRSD